MDIQQLKYIVSLSENLHFGKAAKACHVTQPTLSQQIKQAEDELGALLFERTHRKVRLTKKGERFVTHAKKILETLKKASSEIQDEADSLTANLNVASIPTIGPYVFPKVLAGLRKSAPRIHIQLYELTTPVLLDALRAGKIDFGILSLPFDEKGLAVKELCEENFFVAASKNHALSKKKNIALKQLDSERILILQEGHCFSDQALDYCKRSRNDEQVVFQGSSLLSVLMMTLNEQGITFIPKMAIEAHRHPQLAVVELKPAAKRKIVLAWRMTHDLSFAEKFVIEKTEDHLKKVLCPS